MLMPLSEDSRQVFPLFGVTGMDGTFTIHNVPAGSYIVTAFAAGYLSPLDGVMVSMIPMNDPALAEIKRKNNAVLRAHATTTQVAAQQTSTVTLVLDRGAVLAGRVLYSDGTPANHLPLSLEKVPAPAAEEGKVDLTQQLRRGLGLTQLFTDDEGSFRIAGVASGSYRIAVSQTLSYLSEDKSLDDTNPYRYGALKFYSGDTFHAKEAKLFAVAAGDQVKGIEIKLPLEGLHTIHGFATAKDGTALNAGDLDLVSATDPTFDLAGKIGKNGEFTFHGVPDGTYTLKATDAFLFKLDGFENINRSIIEESNNPNYMPLRAFEDTGLPVVVLGADLDPLSMTLGEGKMPVQTHPNPR